MIYKTFVPHPALSDVIECYSYVKSTVKTPIIQTFATPLLQTMAFNFKLQPGEYVLRDHTDRLDKVAYFFGQYTYSGSLTFPKEIDVFTVRFKPLGIPKITGINMAHLTNGAIAIEDIWSREFPSLYDQMKSMASIEESVGILEQFLIRKKQSVSLSHRGNDVLNALEMITHTRGNILIKEIRSQTNTTRKTLERAFEHHIGILPKLYTRLVRFNAVKNFLDRYRSINNLTPIAVDFGFYDCSHLIEEFKRYARYTPRGFYESTLFDDVVIQYE